MSENPPRRNAPRFPDGPLDKPFGARHDTLMKKLLCSLMLLLPALGCHRAAARPNVILLSVDTLRRDYVGFYNPERKTLTPNLTQLVSDSTAFLHAFTVVPQTFPSFSSTFTGVYPWRHGVVTNQGFSIRKGFTTLGEMFHANHYYTAAAIGGRPLRYGKGIERGFDLYQDNMFHCPSTGNPLFEAQNADWVRYYSSQRRALDVSASAVEILRARPKDGRPFFLFLHYFDPHSPYDPPEPYKSRHAGNLYGGEVAYTDEAVGILLNYLKETGIYDQTLIVFFSDHGEGLGEHGEPYHGYFLYNPTMAVPLAFKFPKSMPSSGPSSIPEAVCLPDLYPTLCDLLGFKTPPDLDGRSLNPWFKGAAHATDRNILLSTEMPYFFFGWEKMYAVLRYPIKAVVCSEPQVFNLAEDPGEEKNLYPRSYADLSSALKRALAAAPPVGGEGTPMKEDVENLRSLGYLTQVPPRKDAGGALPPSRWPEKVRMIADADEIRFKGDIHAALKIYSDFLKDHPDDFQSLVSRADLYLRLHQPGPAVEDLRGALRLNGNNFDVHNFLLTAYRQMGDEKSHWAELQLARAAFSDYLFMTAITEDLLHQHKPDEALAFLAKMMEEHPTDPLPYTRTLSILQGSDRKGQADAFTARILRERKAPSILLSYFSGFDAYMKNRPDEALADLKECCREGAAFAQPYFYAGLIYKEKHALADAVRYFNAAQLLSFDNARYVFEWADAMAGTGHLTEAREGFTRAAALEPGNPNIRLALMKAAWVAGDRGTALQQRDWLRARAPEILDSARRQDALVAQIP